MVMTGRAHTQLMRAQVDDLHPTQLTVGKYEVAIKRKVLANLSHDERKHVIESHWFPGVLGPGNRPYIVDHHHLGLALHEEGAHAVWIMVLKDLRELSIDQFWVVMDHHNWAHPYDNQGIRRDFTSIPGHLSHMQDDPYRSLAGEVRHAGGFAKDVTPFSEFLWADYFRVRIPLEMVQEHFAHALKKALSWASSQEAHYLPGWSGSLEPGT